MNRKERRAAAKERGGKAASPRLTTTGPAGTQLDGLLVLAGRHLMGGRLAEAEQLYRHILAVDPRNIEAYNHLARTFFNQGRVDEALGALRRGIDVGGTAETKRLFVLFLRAQRSLPDADDLRNLMLRALTEPWCRPSEAGPIAASLCKHHAAVRPYVERVKRAWPTRLSASELLGSSGLAAISEQRLLACLLQSTPICDVDLERFLTALRGALLEIATADPSAVVAEGVLGLCCALARQCFLNEYVYADTGDELDRARRLCDSLSGMIRSGAAVPAFALAVVACYFPLRLVPGAAALRGKAVPKPLADLLIQQVAEPEQERRLQSSIPALTAIADAVSLRVRQQYEENPFPRWGKAEPPGRPMTVGQHLRMRFPLAPLQGFPAGPDIEILIAGCGTGQHAIETAQRFSPARVLAVDLSLASLAYAERKTRELALGNIEYAQADILELGSLGRSFDVIEAGGVLHHLADPFAGWRKLLSLLRPGGCMKVGLYSELARTHVAAARNFIAARGFRATADDIRRCRQELMAFDTGTPENRVTRAEDFFTMSECRDLIFHVEEHRLTLPQIGAFLAEADLAFLGFDVGAATQARYRSRFADDLGMVDLANWQRFETENPETFIGMYQFWVRKMARPSPG